MKKTVIILSTLILAVSCSGLLDMTPTDRVSAKSSGSDRNTSWLLQE